MNRREVLSVIAAGSLAACKSTLSSDPAIPISKAVATQFDASLIAVPDGPAMQIVMVMYPMMTAMDLVGPQLFLSSLGNVDVHLVSATMAPVVSDTGLAIMPTATFATAPAAENTHLIFVPGGTEGTLAAMKDATLLAFVKSRAAAATYITSVCTGALILAKAGLLQGYRATSHWVALDLLTSSGAIAVSERVVVDRNRITAAGVTAGLDLGLTVAQLLRSPTFANALALNADYAASAFAPSGTPALADPGLTAHIRAMYAEFRQTAAAT